MLCFVALICKVSISCRVHNVDSTLTLIDVWLRANYYDTSAEVHISAGCRWHKVEDTTLLSHKNMSLILATLDQQTGHNTALNVERNIVNEAEKSQELKYTACLLELGRGARWRAALAGEELGSTRAALAGREGIWCQQQQQLKEREAAAAWSCSQNLPPVSVLSENVQLSHCWTPVHQSNGEFLTKWRDPFRTRRSSKMNVVPKQQTR